MMIAPLLICSLAINYVHSQPQLLTPNCNYAADAAHYYPIGACVRRTDGSFKYTCSDVGGVRKAEWSGDSCDGEPDSRYNVAGGSSPELESFACDLGPCTYSEQCDLEGCAADCSDCIANPDNFNRFCLPWIEDTCTGQGFLTKDRCENGVATQNFYSGARCISDNYIFGLSTSDGECIGNRYYEVTCDIVAPPGPKGAGAGKGASALASDVVIDEPKGKDQVHHRRHHYNLNLINKKHYDLFGFQASLLDLILMSSNAVFVVMCLCFVCVKCVKGIGNKNGKYQRANNEEDGDEISESKLFFNNDL